MTNRQQRPRVAFVRTRLGVGTSINQPLHAMYMVGALRAAGVPECRIIDCEPWRLTDEAVVERLLEWRPDVVGFTAMTVDVPAVTTLSARVREALPEAWIWCGGSHASGDPARTLDALPAVDVAIKGEGERAAVELCERWESGSRDPTGILGTWYRGDGDGIRGNPDRPAETDLDSLPMPAWDAIDIPAYFHRVRRMGVLYQHPRYMTLFTSRACPYRCSYCHATFGKTFHAHSPERVLAEIRILVERHGVRELAIVDDIFNLDVERMVAICEGILRAGLRVHLSFPNGVRGDRFDRHSLAVLRRAGGWRLNFAPETVTERLQRAIVKHNDLRKLEQAIADAADLGFLTQGNFMLGFPTETFAEMKATVDWALASRLHLANFFRVVPLVGTPMAQQVDGEARDLAGDPTQHDINQTRINMSAAADADIERLRRSAYRSFHAAPRRLARLSRVMPRHPTLAPLYAADAVARIGGGLTSGNLYGRWRRRKAAPARRAES